MVIFRGRRGNVKPSRLLNEIFVLSATLGWRFPSNNHDSDEIMRRQPCQGAAERGCGARLCPPRPNGVRLPSNLVASSHGCLFTVRLLGA